MTPSLIDVLLAELTDEQAAEFAQRLAPHLPNGGGTTPPLVGREQAAWRLGIHVRTLTRATTAGRVSGAIRVGRSWRYRLDELAIAPPERSAPPPPPPPRRRPARSNAAAVIKGPSATTRQPTERTRT